jgi:hypothetical protein
MTVSAEIEAEIRRQYFAEHWPVGTVAAQLGQHADVVRRVLKLDEPRVSLKERVLLVEPYKDFIAETLKQYPTLLATRLFDMIRPRGYPGEVRTLRRYVAGVRRLNSREVYLRVESARSAWQAERGHSGSSSSCCRGAARCGVNSSLT